MFYSRACNTALLFIFIEAKVTLHEIDHFKTYNSLTFSTFTMM